MSASNLPPPRIAHLAAFTLLVAVGSCIRLEPEGEIGAPTLATVQSQIFTQKCAMPSCHGGPSPQAGMSLEAGKAVASTANVRAVGAPLARIKPGDPDNSYLVAKIEGRANEVGGSGERMPLGAAALGPLEIQLIRDWITQMSDVPLDPPNLTRATPPAAAAGDSVAIEGLNFGDKRNASTIAFGGIEVASYGNWSGSKVEVVVPAGLTPGDTTIVATVAGRPSNALPFTVRAERVASLVDVTPDLGGIGAVVTLTGSNLGDAQGASTVKFAGTDAGPARSWSPTKIEVAVPAGARQGDVVVTVNGKDSNGVAFYPVFPQFSSIQSAIFDRRCATAPCHGAANPPPFSSDCASGGRPGMLLTGGSAYAETVGVPSCEDPSIVRIASGSRASSYLFMKISSSTPPHGKRMPTDGTAPLPDDVIEIVGTWIDQGAKGD